MEKENWIEDVLNSTNGMAQVLPADTLFTKIQNKITKVETISPQWLWIAAASLLLLASLNIKIWCSKTHHQNTSVERIASSLSNSNQLY